MRLLASATWTGTNADEIRDVAPERYEGVSEAAVLVRGDDGEVIHARPGWTVSAWDDGAGGVSVVVAKPGPWAVISLLLSDLAAARGEAA